MLSTVFPFVAFKRDICVSKYSFTCSDAFAKKVSEKVSFDENRILFPEFSLRCCNGFTKMLADLISHF